MNKQYVTAAVASTFIAIAATGADAQVKRNGVWQGGDAQRGNPHGLSQEVLHRPPQPCTELVNPQRGVFLDPTWPDGVIPYAFDANVSDAQKTAMLEAMGQLAITADVTFIERSTEVDFIRIRDANGNSSFVGRIGGAQEIRIINWNFRYIMVHELMHALGFFHEQTAVDRDQFVTINQSNIQPNALINFVIQPNANVTSKYDYQSVMHYGAFFFAIDPSIPTIITTDPGFQDLIGQREFLSPVDEEGLVTLLGPPVPSTWLDVSPIPGSLTFGSLATPAFSLEQALIFANSFGLLGLENRIVNVQTGTDTVSASPGSPLVINQLVRIEGTRLTIE
ncbi:MAG: M12 family metallopeptidase [Phycisphaerales bacterium]